MAKNVSARKTTFCKSKLAMEAKGGTLRPNESFGKTHRAEKKLKNSTVLKKIRQFHRFKSNKEVTRKSSETYFLYRSPQKLKIAKKSFSKSVFEKITKNSLHSLVA